MKYFTSNRTLLLGLLLFTRVVLASHCTAVNNYISNLTMMHESRAITQTDVKYVSQLPTLTYDELMSRIPELTLVGSGGFHDAYRVEAIDSQSPLAKYNDDVVRALLPHHRERLETSPVYREVYVKSCAVGNQVIEIMNRIEPEVAAVAKGYVINADGNLLGEVFERVKTSEYTQLGSMPPGVKEQAFGVIVDFLNKLWVERLADTGIAFAAVGDIRFENIFVKKVGDKIYLKFIDVGPRPYINATSTRDVAIEYGPPYDKKALYGLLIKPYIRKFNKEPPWLPGVNYNGLYREFPTFASWEVEDDPLVKVKKYEFDPDTEVSPADTYGPALANDPYSLTQTIADLRVSLLRAYQLLPATMTNSKGVLLDMARDLENFDPADPNSVDKANQVLERFSLFGKMAANGGRQITIHYIPR